MGFRQAKLPAALCAALVTTALMVIALAAPAAQAGPGRLGIDVSRFQAEIDWTAVKADGVRFAFVAASRGAGGKDCPVVPDECGADQYFRANYDNARSQKIRVGPYHRAFVDGANEAELLADARAEADVFISSVGKLTKKDLAPALDVETPFTVPGPSGLKKWIRTWVKRVNKKLGAKPLIYTNTSSWSATGNTTEFANRGHHLWVANWGVSKPSVPAGNWGGAGWTVWQYTSSGSVDGISGRVDMNRFKGSFRKISAG